MRKKWKKGEGGGGRRRRRRRRRSTGEDVRDRSSVTQ
jgi:hypothetical protein